MDAAWKFLTVDADKAAGKHEQLAPDADDHATGDILTITHSDYVDASQWTLPLEGIGEGSLVEIRGRASLTGPCQQQIAPDRFIDGAALTIYAIPEDGVTFDRGSDFAQLAFSRFSTSGASSSPTKPAPFDSDRVDCPPGSAWLVVAPGTKSVNLGARLTGVGTAEFTIESVTISPADPNTLNARLVDSLVRAGSVRSAEVERAFRRVRRDHFLPRHHWGVAFRDEAIPTHFAEDGTTSISSSSQPTMMAIMLEELAVAPGSRILEIGAGTGYNAAVMSALAGPEGGVWTIDLDADFCREAREHLEMALARPGTGTAPVTVICGDGWEGYPDAAPYDRIIVTAGAFDIAPAWADQLREGGLIVIPWGSATAQRAVTFRKDGRRFVMEKESICFFMLMRGSETEATAQNVPPGTTDWNDWLFAGQSSPNPVSLVAYPSGEAPCPKAHEHLIRKRWFDYIAAWQ